MSANEWELGVWLLAIERTRAYESSGFRSTVGFAVARLGIEAQKAWNLLRIMGVLEKLPRLSDAFQAGEIGYAKIREVTRVVTSETESSWLEFACSHTTDQVRQRVVCSPAAFERRVRSIRHQADSLFSRPASPDATCSASKVEVNGAQAKGLGQDSSLQGSAVIVGQAERGQPIAVCPLSPAQCLTGDRGINLADAGEPEGLQSEAFSPTQAGGSAAAAPRAGHSEARALVDSPRALPLQGSSYTPEQKNTLSAEPRQSGYLVSSGVAPELSSVEEDGLPAPQRVRLVIELSAEEYAEWGATVERVSRQLGHRASSREVILELARRHVASTGGSSLQRNPVVVRLEPDGSGNVQTDRGPLAVNRQSVEEYLSRASSIVAPGSQASVLLLGGRRRKRLPSDVLRALVARSEGCCESCSQRGLLHIHHLRPLSRGGTNALENLRLLCSACHSREHVEDFKPGSDWERARERRRRTQTAGGRRARAGGSDP